MKEEKAAQTLYQPGPALPFPLLYPAWATLGPSLSPLSFFSSAAQQPLPSFLSPAWAAPGPFPPSARPPHSRAAPSFLSLTAGPLLSTPFLSPSPFFSGAQLLPEIPGELPPWARTTRLLAGLYLATPTPCVLSPVLAALSNPRIPSALLRRSAPLLHRGLAPPPHRRLRRATTQLRHVPRNPSEASIPTPSPAAARIAREQLR
jgi:hypothetical protein